MNLSFDYYHNLKEVEFYLCNPDGRQLFPLVGVDRKLKLRFNDLSELTFSCYATATANDGAVITVDAYNYVQTRRLIFVTGIGWFVITNATEVDNGIAKYKNVTCHSLQAAFKDRGFYCEERVYYFYNPSDPTDSQYDPNNDASVPSVVGQLYQQLGIQQELTQGLSDPATPYLDWTITYINDSLVGKARNFKESTNYGYEWMVKDVEEAFEVIILFDFYNKTIHVMHPSEITSKANVIYSFSNFMKEVEIEEDAENIVTVMNCNGDNCDIAGVNPTGTNYICDFSYYMDTDGKWMSSALKDKINAWKTAVESAKPGYENKVLQLRTAYDNLNSVNSSLQEISRIYTDLSAAVARKSVALADGSTLGGIVWCETVNVGEASMDENSVFYNTELERDKRITVYKNMPSYDSETGKWSLSGDNYTGTIDECYNYVDESHNQYLYFIDNSAGNNGITYCTLQGTSHINATTYETEYLCKGFKRYIGLSFANVWMTKYDSRKSELQNSKTSYEETITSKQSELEAIATSVNIINYFSNTPSLLKELYCYWVEGEYTNDNIAVDEETTQAEAIDLENELLESGVLELSKVCQPKLQFSLTSADCTKQYEFRSQMNALELGKVITVEKEEGVWYYPALLEIEYDLDKSDTFDLRFANALRLDDWGYTYGDLMSDAASTSRKISANWQNILAYSKDKEEMSPLIKEPLSSTLRAAFANMKNQEFTIDETGILGRKFVDPDQKDSFENEQVRIINNVILFTDDNWNTARSAFGKIYYTDDDGNTVSAYGMIGDTIIGSLMMSEKLKIKNADSSVELGKDGITIMSGEDIVFSAKPDGTLIVKNFATEEEVSASFSIIDGKIQSVSEDLEGAKSSIIQQADEIALVVADLYDVNSDMKSVKSSIIQHADSIELLVERADGAESSITQHADEIQLLVEEAHDARSDITTAQSKITQHATAIEAVVKRVGDAESTIRQQADEIAAKVESDYSGSSFGWSLTANGFTLTSNGTEVMSVDANGLDVVGNIRMESGQIADDISLGTYGTFHFYSDRYGACGIESNRGDNGLIFTETDFSIFGYYNMYINAPNIYLEAREGELIGTWKLGSGAAVLSDVNHKNSISGLNEKYDAFFDELHPVSYKYNEGTSGRDHVGFIAQDVCNALSNANVQTSEFAGYIESEDADGNKTCYLRYEEFIALNTAQIQMLKARVKELEETVERLQNKE